ncbi:MAG: SMI1/KNR4 family protein [Chlamydiota bacterium]
MNSLIRQFFTSGGGESNFCEVLFLTDGVETSWKDISERAPSLPRGWFELSRVNSSDRIEFTRDFWLDRLPYQPSTQIDVCDFFERLDDVAVVLLRKKEEEFLSAELVYSLKDGSTFFRGKVPAVEVDLDEMKNEMGVLLPRDYIAFLHIHNGFGMLSEMGLLSTQEIPDVRRQVSDFLVRSDRPIKSGSSNVDPGSLIPFYEIFGLSSYQCFYSDWYPGAEMGNVYLSGIDYTISDTSDRTAWTENLAFPTFLEWLSYYLQGMNLAP